MDESTAHARMQIGDAIDHLQLFSGADLTRTLSRIEISLEGIGSNQCHSVLSDCRADSLVLGAAGVVKRLAGQINVIVHALGILLCLPHLLQRDELIEYVSLGAGNTGKAFDLETNLRVAEFKFINWQGGSESIRQNSLFKDFYELAEYEGNKHRHLYVLGTEYPTKFLNGGRAMTSVLSKEGSLQRRFELKHGQQYRTVREYFLPRRHLVELKDVSQLVPELVAANDVI